MKKPSIALLSAVVASSMLVPPVASGQSGTRQQDRPAAAPGDAALALRGYCPVCLLSMKKWVPGKPEFAITYDGHTYRFPGSEQMEMFRAEPAKYTPVLHGDCVVCLQNMGKRVPGDLNFAQIYQGRIYLFPSEEQRQMFRAEPAKYVDADLAMGGNCSVCQVEMGQEVPGKPEYAAHFNGLRYLFPGPEQRSMFLANPAKYAVDSEEGRGPAAGRQSSMARPDGAIRTVSISGRTSCAGCDHGVKPLGDPDQLGLAVVTDAGTLYVVEGAHELYPKLYEERFGGLEVALAGEILREQGQVIWVRPTSLKAIR